MPSESDLDVSGSPLFVVDELRTRLLRAVPSKIGQVPTLRDKWVLSSALQKLIRRGRSREACAVAVRLHQVDPGYLPRRLPIIAIEDVGTADLLACYDVFVLASSSQWWKSGGLKTIRFVVNRLSAALKCRAACDALCLSELQDASPEFESLRLAPEARLVDIASDRSVTAARRSAALRLLGGITVRAGATYRSISRCRPDALVAVAANLEMPGPIKWLMARQARSGSLAALLPIAWEMSEGAVVHRDADFPHSMEFAEGVPLAAVDMFSDVGRSALRDFVRSSHPLRDFLRQHASGKSEMRLVNMAVFHAESQILDRRLSSAGIEALTHATHEAEVRHLGLREPSQRAGLEEILKSESPKLAWIRRRALESISAQMSLFPLEGRA